MPQWLKLDLLSGTEMLPQKCGFQQFIIVAIFPVVTEKEALKTGTTRRQKIQLLQHCAIMLHYLPVLSCVIYCYPGKLVVR